MITGSATSGITISSVSSPGLESFSEQYTNRANQITEFQGASGTYFSFESASSSVGNTLTITTLPNGNVETSLVGYETVTLTFGGGGQLTSTTPPDNLVTSYLSSVTFSYAGNESFTMDYEIVSVETPVVVNNETTYELLSLTVTGTANETYDYTGTESGSVSSVTGAPGSANYSTSSFSYSDTLTENYETDFEYDALAGWLITSGSGTASGARSWDGNATTKTTTEGYVHGNSVTTVKTTISSGSYSDEWSSESAYTGGAWALTSGTMTGSGSAYYKQSSHDTIGSGGGWTSLLSQEIDETFSVSQTVANGAWEESDLSATITETWTSAQFYEQVSVGYHNYCVGSTVATATKGFDLTGLVSSEWSIEWQEEETLSASGVDTSTETTRSYYEYLSSTGERHGHYYQEEHYEEYGETRGHITDATLDSNGVSGEYKEYWNDVVGFMILTGDAPFKGGSFDPSYLFPGGYDPCSPTGGGACFTAGTQIVVGKIFDENDVFVQYITVNIEDIKVGDWVYSYDTITGEVSLKEVTDVFVRQSDHINYLTIEDEEGNIQVLEVTDAHPFWVVTDDPDLERAARSLVDENGVWLYHANIGPTENGFWVEAKDLREGDVFLGANGELLTLVDMERVEFPDGVTVYNFTVEGNHNYFVIAACDEYGQTSILVHNAEGYRGPPCGGGCGGGYTEYIPLKGGMFGEAFSANAGNLKAFLGYSNYIQFKTIEHPCKCWQSNIDDHYDREKARQEKAPPELKKIIDDNKKLLTLPAHTLASIKYFWNSIRSFWGGQSDPPQENP